MRPQSTDPSEKYRAIVSDLAAIIGHVRKSLELIEAEIGSEMSPEKAPEEGIIVLDDVTPGYERAHSVLRQCDCGLRAALTLLQGSMPKHDRSGEFAA